MLRQLIYLWHLSPAENTTFFGEWLVGKNQEADPLHQRCPFPDLLLFQKIAYQWLRLFAL